MSSGVCAVTDAGARAKRISLNTGVDVSALTTRGCYVANHSIVDVLRECTIPAVSAALNHLDVVQDCEWWWYLR